MIRAKTCLRASYFGLAFGVAAVSGVADCTPTVESISRVEAIAQFSFAAREPDIDTIPEAVIFQSQLVNATFRAIPEDLANPKADAMKHASPKIFDRFGYSFFSFGQLQDVTVPGFSGLVFESGTNHIVANLAVVETAKDSIKYSVLLEKAIRSARMFDRPGDWYKALIDTVFEKSRTISWHQPYISFLDERTVERFREKSPWFIALAKFYGVGHRRPIWILLDLPDDSPASYQRASLAANDIFARTSRNPILRPDKILVHGSDQLLVLEQDSASLRPTCVDALRVNSSK